MVNLIKMRYPTISVVIPAFNESANLTRLFNSLKGLTYPRSKLEYIFIDDSSTDDSQKIARKFGAKIIQVKTHDIERNKGIGLHKAKGEFIYWLDADMKICSWDFFELLITPHLENNNIVGSFTKEFALECPEKVTSSLLRFISYDELQRDPLYQFFSPSIASTIEQKKSKYFICKFVPGEIPPCGRILYNRKKLLTTPVKDNSSFIDLETTEIVARAGYNLFAYVPSARIRHYHAESLTLLVKKRLRNLQRDYLPNIENKYYTWFDLHNPKDVGKIIFWVIYANLFLPELVRGGVKMIKYKDLAFLWQPIVSITTTDAILWGFLSKKTGRMLALTLITSLFPQKRLSK